eukprot:1276879-Prymnesium_polylepis.1
MREDSKHEEGQAEAEEEMDDLVERSQHCCCQKVDPGMNCHVTHTAWRGAETRSVRSDVTRATEFKLFAIQSHDAKEHQDEREAYQGVLLSEQVIYLSNGSDVLVDLVVVNIVWIGPWHLEGRGGALMRLLKDGVCAIRSGTTSAGVMLKT